MFGIKSVNLDNLIGEKISIDFVGCFGYSVNFGKIVDVTYDEEHIYLLNETFSEFEISLNNIENIKINNTGCNIKYQDIFLTLEVN